MSFVIFKRKELRLPFIFILIAICTCLLLFSGIINRVSIFSYQQHELSRTADVATLTFDNNIESYIYTLYGIRGLVNTNNVVSRKEFNTFVSSLALPRRLPGATAIGYARLISSKEKVAFEAEVLNDTSIELAGYPNFSIHPTQQKEVYLPLIYVEPSNLTSSREALGFDMLSDQERQSTYEKARDSNRAMMSSKVIAAATKLDSFILMLPVYDVNLPITSVEDRQTAITGMVTMALRRVNLFNAAFAVFLEKNPALEIRVYEGSVIDEQYLVYDSNQDKKVLGVTSNLGHETEVRTIDKAGKTWTIEYRIPRHTSLMTIPFPLMAIPLFAILIGTVVGLIVSLRSVKTISI